MSILLNSINFFGFLPWIGRRKEASKAAATLNVQTLQHAKKLSTNDQWDRLSGVVTSAITSATPARELQTSASQQLDLATYALYNLFDELTAVMSEPLMREAAVVHRLQPKSGRQRTTALAA